MSIYPACFFEEDNGYSLIFPDLNYLSACGSTLQEAMEMAVDCLAGFLFSARIDGEDIPKPSDIENIDVKKKSKELGFESKSDFVNLISVDVEEYAKIHFNRAVKKTLTIPEWLNEEAISRKINFSKVLQEALIEKLKSQ